MDEQTGFYRATAQIEVSETTFDELAIAVSGSITFENAAEVSEKFKRIFDENPLKMFRWISRISNM